LPTLAEDLRSKRRGGDDRVRRWQKIHPNIEAIIRSSGNLAGAWTEPNDQDI
jgi:hypothetical protein